jgi:transposase
MLMKRSKTTTGCAPEQKTGGEVCPANVVHAPGGPENHPPVEQPKHEDTTEERATESPENTEDLDLAQVIHPYGVGVDTHSQFIQVCVLVRSGGTVRRFEATFRTLWERLGAARAWVAEKLGQLAPHGFRYCIESTGTYHLPVVQAFGGQPSVVNPLLAGPTRRKTDVLDARLLAHHSITGLWKESYVAPPQVQQLRLLWQQQRESARRATRISNRLNGIVLRFGHTFGALAPMRSREGLANLETLLAERTPCGPALCPAGLPDAIKPLVQSLVQDMKAATAATRSWGNEALAYLRSCRWPTGKGDMAGADLYHLLRTVPGVGEATAITWLAEVGDPNRFAGPKQVAAYCGCDPSLKVSAGKVTSQTRRRGNDKLHWVLVNAASGVLRRHSEPLGRWGRSIAGRHRKGGFRKACGAVARRQAIGLWRVHMLAEPFSYDGYQLAAPPDVPDVPVGQMGLGRCEAAVRRAGFTLSRALVEAAYRGELPLGIGFTAREKITAWVERHRTRRPPLESARPGSKTYALKPGQKFVPSAARGTAATKPCPPKKEPPPKKPPLKDSSCAAPAAPGRAAPSLPKTARPSTS